ncbi:MAG: NAD-dependent dehydratase, partial [Zavarzinia sp.]|nr:NAD-dependent dehydratase [Zavarzinia sp.]
VNFGSDNEISIGDTARLIAEVIGVEIEIEADDQRLRPALSEVERLWASNEKARRLLGWAPRIDLREGLARTVDWFRDPANLGRYKAGQYNI